MDRCANRGIASTRGLMLMNRGSAIECAEGVLASSDATVEDCTRARLGLLPFRHIWVSGARSVEDDAVRDLLHQLAIARHAAALTLRAKCGKSGPRMR